MYAPFGADEVIAIARCAAAGDARAYQIAEKPVNRFRG